MDNQARDFSFSSTDFNRIRKMIYSLAGISLSESKDDMVYSRITRRLRALKINSFKDYLDLVEFGKNEAEVEHFINSLTTNLTAFYREEHHFPVLADYIKKTPGEIRIWCSAASTGEEPYSIAMTACDAFGSTDIPVKIIATDIDTNVLLTAEKGIYTDDRVKDVPFSQKSKYMKKGVGQNAGSIRINSDVRHLIEFKQLNLLDANYGFKEQFDIIFCRNVMIYFDKQTQSSILKKFYPLLKPRGLLFAGHSENFTYITDDYKLLGKTVYGKSKW